MPIILFVLAILGVVGIFGVSSSAQSYATAKQAEAQIELAQVAQVNAWGNLMSLVILALVILMIIACLLAFAYIRTRQPAARGGSVRGHRPQIHQAEDQAPLIDPQQIQLLVSLKILEMLQGGSRPQLPSQTDETADDILPWLRK